MIKKIIITLSVIASIILVLNLGLFINFKLKTDTYEKEAAALTEYSFITSTKYLIQCEREFTGLINFEVRFNEWNVSSYDMPEYESRFIFKVNPLFTDFDLEHWHPTSPHNYEDFPQDIIQPVNLVQKFIHPKQEAVSGIYGDDHIANCPAYVSFTEPMTYSEVIDSFGSLDEYRVKWCWVDTYSNLSDYNKTFTTGFPNRKYNSYKFNTENTMQAFGFMLYEGGYQGFHDNTLYIENPLEEFIRIMNTDYGDSFLANEIYKAKKGITDGTVTADDIKIIGVILEKKGNYDIDSSDAQEIITFDNIRFVNY